MRVRLLATLFALLALSACSSGVRVREQRDAPENETSETALEEEFEAGLEPPPPTESKPEPPPPPARAHPSQVPPAEDARLPRFEPMWRIPLEARDVSLAVAPWGDVALLKDKQLSLYAHEDGRLIARYDFTWLWTLDEDSIGFVPDGSLLIVAQGSIDRIDFGAESWDRLKKLGSARRAYVRGADVLLFFSKRCEHVRWPELEPLGETEVEAFRLRSLALSPDARFLATSGGFRGKVQLHDLTSGEARLLRSDDPPVLHLSGDQLLVRERGVDLPWSLESGRRVGYGLGGPSTIGILALPKGNLLAYGHGGASVFPPLEAPLPESTAWKGTLPYKGLPLAEAGRTTVAAVNSAGSGLALFSGKELALYRAGEFAARPFDPAALSGRTPEKPGMEAVLGDKRQQTFRRLKGRMAHSVEFMDKESLREQVYSFVDEPGEQTEAWFVRLKHARLGGEFDTAGDEEVVFTAHLGNRRRRLAFDVLDLPSKRMATFEDVGSGTWLELPVAPEGTLDIAVGDIDATTTEAITSLTDELELAPAGFALEPREQRLPLADYSLTELTHPRQVKLSGGFLDVEWVKAPRRDAPDDASREAVRAAFGRALEADPSTREGAEALAAWLPKAAREGLLSAGRSTHTRVRSELAQLSKQAFAVGQLVKRYGRPSRSAERLAAFLADAKQKEILDQAVRESLKALEQVKLSDPPTVAELDALIEQGLWLKVDNQLSTRHPLDGFFAPELTELLEAAHRERTSLSPELAAEFQREWASFHSALKAALE